MESFVFGKFVFEFSILARSSLIFPRYDRSIDSTSDRFTPVSALRRTHPASGSHPVIALPPHAGARGRRSGGAARPGGAGGGGGTTTRGGLSYVQDHSAV